MAPQNVNQDDFQPSELGYGAGALSGTYDAIDPSWPEAACREALRSGK